MADNRAFNRLLEDLATGGVDIRWNHAEVLDDPLAWAAGGLSWRREPDGEAPIELHQYRDETRSWFMLRIDARVDRPQLLHRLRRAAELIADPVQWEGAWTREDTYDWRARALR